MRRYAIIYDDGTEYSNEDGPLENAPCDGVIVIVQEDETVGRELLHMRDFYYWERGRWWSADQYGRDHYLRRPGWRKILCGVNVENEIYWSLFDRAEKDPRFPPKSARLFNELPKVRSDR